MKEVKSPHDYFQRLCAIAATNQTSPEEDQRLAEHLQLCLVCKQTFEDFSQIAAQLYAEAPTSGTATAAFVASSEEPAERVRAKERLVWRIRKANRLRLTEERLIAPAEEKTRGAFFVRRVPSWAAWALAATLLLAVSLDSARYWTSRRHSRDAEEKSTSLQRELEDLRGQLARVQAGQREPARQTAAGTEKDALEKLQAASGDLRQKLQTIEAARQREAAEYAELQERIRLLQSSIQVLQAANSRLDAEKSGLAEKVSTLTADLRQSQDAIARLAARNDELSQESLARVRSAERQQKLLATDHDIRDILGARSLHIIDVFDVSSQGEFERPFGRIFYTEGKSLIFYAFDLDQQKGLKRGAVFQAWGQKGEGKQDPRNLGAFYMDDPSQNRWVLKVDDSKVLSRIDYVFVTDNSRKDSARPRGKPLLSTSLNGIAIHP